jgi:Zn-dependent protease
VTFLVLLAWIGLVNYREQGSLAAAASGIAFILTLFGCVVLHEFGHALVARRFGIATRDVTLLPIGGVARLERMPEQPIQEFWVAVAGPAVNVVLAAGLGLWLMTAGDPVSLLEVDMGQGTFVARLLVVNIALVIFNLLPAFPMDGGRIFRALLATRLPYPRATKIAAGVGQGFAFAFGFLGLLGNPFLLFIALFVWIGAGQEARSVETRFALASLPVSRAMVTEFRSVPPQGSLGEVVALTLASSQRDFPVIEGGDVVGILCQRDLLAGLSQRGPEGRVAESMHTEFISVEAEEPLEAVLSRLENIPCRTMPVLSRGKVVGLLTMDNLGELLAIRAAVARSAEASHRAIH